MPTTHNKYCAFCLFATAVRKTHFCEIMTKKREPLALQQVRHWSSSLIRSRNGERTQIRASAYVYCEWKAPLDDEGPSRHFVNSQTFCEKIQKR
jgi:hypothetical protein